MSSAIYHKASELYRSFLAAVSNGEDIEPVGLQWQELAEIVISQETKYDEGTRVALSRISSSLMTIASRLLRLEEHADSQIEALGHQLDAISIETGKLASCSGGLSGEPDGWRGNMLTSSTTP